MAPALPRVNTQQDDGKKGDGFLERKGKLRIHLDDLSHRATPPFVNLVDCATVLRNAVRHVNSTLYSARGNEPPVRSVTLILESMGGVAYTTGIPLDDTHKEIHLSLDYLANQIGDQARFRAEAIGVITHEMVHCFQHNCLGTAPGGLIEGIADYVRLKCGLAPPHWKKTPDQLGKKWDEGYQKTAWFLEWLENKYGEGSISRLNASMDGHKYVESEFWQKLFGTSVLSLWDQYLKEWDKKPDTTTLVQPSLATLEPDTKRLNEQEKVIADKGPKQ